MIVLPRTACVRPSTRLSKPPRPQAARAQLGPPDPTRPPPISPDPKVPVVEIPPGEPAGAPPPPRPTGGLRGPLRRLQALVGPGKPPRVAPYASVKADMRQAVALPVEGRLPDDLQGTLYRNGPAEFEIYGKALAHLFDGNGLTTAVRLHDGRATYQSAFVDTWEKVREDRSKKHLFPSFGTPAPRGIFDVLRGMTAKNPANVNVIYFDGQLFALSDVGWAYRLDPHTLQTHGMDDLGLSLGRRAGFCAHPKLHQRSGALWGFSATYVPEARLNLFHVLPRHGKNTHASRRPPAHSIKLPYAAVIHDFCLTDTKAVFVLVPYCVKPFPLGLVLGLSTPSEALEWKEELGTTVLTVDLASGAQTWSRGETLFALHHVAAWDSPDGGVFIDTCGHPDPEVIKLVGDDAQPDVGIHAKLTRLHAHPNGTLSARTLSDTVIEFPRRLARMQGKPYTSVFGLTLRPNSPRETLPVRIDVGEDGSISTATASLGPGETARECVPVQKAGTTSESDVWLLSFIKNDPHARTDLRIFDGSNLAAGAVCNIPLPQLIPADIHGNWVPEGTSGPAID